MTRNLTAFALLVISALFAHGQSPEIDSLKGLLKRTGNSTGRIDVLNALSTAYFHYNIDQSHEYANTAYELSVSLGYLKGKRFSLVQMGLTDYRHGEYKKALRLYRQALAKAGDEDDLNAYNFVLIGNVYQAIANYDSAVYFYNKAIELETQLASIKYLGFAYKNMAKVLVLQWKNEEAEQYISKALVIYGRLNSKQSLAETWFALAEVKLNLSQVDEAHGYINNACAVAESVQDDYGQLYCYINQGEIHFSIADYPESLRNLFAALNKMERLEMPGLLARIYQDLGDVYEALGQNQVAMKYYIESLKLAERIGIKFEIAKVQSSISYIHKNERNFNLAHSYIDQSLRLREAIKDQNGISMSLNRKGLIYLEEQKYDSALTCFERSLEIRKGLGNKAGISTSLFNIGKVLEKKLQFEEALKHYQEVLVLENEINNKYNLAVAYGGLGSLYTSLKNYSMAYEYLTKAASMSNQIGSKSLQMNTNQYMAAYFEAIGDFRSSLVFQKKYAGLNDSIYSEMSAGKLAELQALYQVEKKDQEIVLLNQQKELQNNQISLQKSRINFQTIIIASVVLGFLLVSLLAFKTYQFNKRFRKANKAITEQKEEIQSQSEELIEANSTIADINKELENKIENRTKALTQAYKELDTFFYRSSHDFRRPLTTFLGLAEVANVTVKDPNALELFEKVRETAVNLDKMLVKLQSISDVGAQQLVYKEVFLKEIFDNICDDFRDELQRKNIRTTAEVMLNHPFVSYPAMVKTILENLVENAIQFSGFENPYIRLRMSASGNYVTIDLHDNGHGINKEYHDQIFDMYFRGSERSKGNGLGLYIVKKAVEKLDGSITLSSIAGVGSTFTVMLPNNFQD